MSGLSFDEKCIECDRPISSRYDHAGWCKYHPSNRKFATDGGARVDRADLQDPEHTEHITAIGDLVPEDLVERHLRAARKNLIDPDSIGLLAGARWAFDCPTRPETDLSLARSSLEKILEVSDDSRARFHARSALQYIAIGETRLEDPSSRRGGVE